MSLELITKSIIIFLIAAFVGWVYEIIFYYFADGAFTNRGVLYGPWLPIYGIGAVLILFFKSLKKHPIVLFLSLMVITGVVEYIGGYVLLHMFCLRLWDYTGLFLNLDGFICLRSLLTFAVGGMVLLYFIEPKITQLLSSGSYKLNRLVALLTIIFIIDGILSILYRTPHT